MSDVVEKVADATKAIAGLGTELLITLQPIVGMRNPKKMVKSANAIADVASILQEAHEKAPDVEFSIDEKGFNARVINRLFIQECEKQKNIDSIVDAAYELLKDKMRTEAKNPEKDWLLRFFNSVEDISDEYVQKHWTKILAGEFEKPGSYSYVTLSVLNKMSKSDIKLFSKISKYVLKFFNRFAVYDDVQLLERENISILDLTYLQELGLISVNPLGLSTENGIIYRTPQNVLTCKEKNKEIVITLYVLTSAGAQMLKLTQEEIDEYYFFEVAKSISKISNNGVSYHKIISVSENAIEYEPKDLLVK